MYCVYRTYSADAVSGIRFSGTRSVLKRYKHLRYQQTD